MSLGLSLTLFPPPSILPSLVLPPTPLPPSILPPSLFALSLADAASPHSDCLGELNLLDSPERYARLAFPELQPIHPHQTTTVHSSQPLTQHRDEAQKETNGAAPHMCGMQRHNGGSVEQHTHTYTHLNPHTSPAAAIHGVGFAAAGSGARNNVHNPSVADGGICAEIQSDKMQSLIVVAPGDDKNQLTSCGVFFKLDVKGRPVSSCTHTHTHTCKCSCSHTHARTHDLQLLTNTNP